MSRETAFLISTKFKGYCDGRSYQFILKDNQNCIRLEISNLLERVIVNVYHTGKIVVQGKQNKLNAEISKIKDNIELICPHF